MKAVGWAVLATLCLAPGCATVKSDAKAVAEVCRPELLPDAAQALPLVAALAICEAQGGSCQTAVTALEALGRADAEACAAAQLHAAAVKLAAKGSP